MRIFNDCILKVIKLLYDVLKADNHWFKTYHDHYIDKLSMISFIYNSCLLYISFIISLQIDSRIVSMQTDDTLILADQSFAIVEKEAIHSAKIMIKTREQLTFINLLKFNDTRIERLELNEIDIIYFRQETHIQGIQLIQLIESTITSARDKIRVMLILRDQYIVQRAREAYLTSICQSETSFDLSHVAQSTEITSDDINVLNKRLQWQIINQIKDLKYVRLNQTFLCLVIFIDSSFVNNSDLFSQIDYVICLTDATHANILHWSSIKCKKSFAVCLQLSYSQWFTILMSTQYWNQFSSKCSTNRFLFRWFWSLTRSFYTIVWFVWASRLKNVWWLMSWFFVNSTNVEKSLRWFEFTTSIIQSTVWSRSSRRQF